MTRVDVFQATVPLGNAADASHAAAFEAALKVVLVRATGRRSAEDEAVFAQLVNNAGRYVQQYRSAPDHQLSVAFDGAAIDRWLTQNGQPLWGSDRPSTFIWLSVPAATQTGAAPTVTGSAPPVTILSSEDTSELKTAIDAAAEQRGIPLMWPSAEAASGGAAANPAEAAHRLGAEGVLIGRATNATPGANVRWTLIFQDRSSELTGVLEGVEHAADLYAGIYAASGSLAPVDVDVGGLVDLHDYATVLNYFGSLNFVAHVGVESLSGDTVRFRLSTRGGIETLQHAIDLNGRLQSVPAGDDGIQRFQLRR